MTAALYQIQRAIVRLSCSSCGAEANASCDCAKPYVPASTKAASAVVANPEKSDRAIAAEIGVGKDTVRRAREETGAHAPVDERVGLDGKTRRMPRRPIEEPETDIEGDIDPDNRRAAFLLRADQARQFAVYEGPVDKDIYVAARLAATTWQLLALNLQRKIGEKG